MIDILEKLLLRRPFEPFQIVLRNGDILEVIRPLQVALGRTRFTYAVTAENAGRFQHRGLDQISDLKKAAATH